MTFKMGQQYDLTIDGITHKVVYSGESGGWLTFTSIVGKYQIWQFSPETVEQVSIKLSVNSEILAPIVQPQAELVPFSPEVLANPVLSVVNEPILIKGKK